MPAPTHIAKADPRNPVKVDVRFVPETGSKRPYEIWLSTAAGRWYQRGSFASERSANASADRTREMFGI